MTAKRLDSRAAFLAVGLCLAIPAVAVSQPTGGVWRLPENGTARAATGIQPAPQPQAIVVQPQPRNPRSTVFRRAPYGHSPYGQLPYGATPIPAVLLRDGQVYANFGNGYEPVYRSCYARSVVVGQPTVVGANGVVLSPARPPTYTQPVPNQQTASQQMSAQATGTQRVGVSGAAQSACYNRDGAGRLFVVRF